MIRTNHHEVSADARIVEIVLDRPDKKNALTPEMAEMLVAAIAAESGGSDASTVPLSAAMVLRGAGDAFCAGFDLKLCHQDPDNLRRLLDALSAAVVGLRSFPGTVVCAVHGAAVAGGCALLGGADVVLSSPDAKLGYSAVKLGISPGVSAPWLMQAVGSGGARQMMLDPALISAEQAHALGLVHEIVPGDPTALIAKAMAVAGEAAAKPTVGLHATKRLLNELDGSLDPARVRSALETSLGLVGDEESARRLAAMWGRSGSTSSDPI